MVTPIMIGFSLVDLGCSKITATLLVMSATRVFLLKFSEPVDSLIQELLIVKGRWLGAENLSSHQDCDSLGSGRRVVGDQLH